MMRILLIALALLTLTGCDRIRYEIYSEEMMTYCEDLKARMIKQHGQFGSGQSVMECYNAMMDAYVDHGIEYDKHGDIKVKKRRYQ